MFLVSSSVDTLFWYCFPLHVSMKMRYVEYLYENMKCNVDISFSLFILINTPHYAVFVSHFV